MTKRAKNKVMINAWVDHRIAAGIEEFLKNNPLMNRTDFLIEAVCNYLADHHIEIAAEALRGYRPQKPLPVEAYEGVKYIVPPQAQEELSAGDQSLRLRIDRAAKKSRALSEQLMELNRCLGEAGLSQTAANAAKRVEKATKTLGAKSKS